MPFDRSIDTLFIHCSATRPMWMHGLSIVQQTAAIRRWHIERGWSNIGYHFLIGREGQTVVGRPIELVGAHAKGHNTGSIATCLIGGHGASATDAFGDHFTLAQDQALRTHIATIVGIFGDLEIKGHNEVAAKGCPGFQVRPWFEAVGNWKTPAGM